jgi:Outer membrane protein beta-barrel domain
MLRTFIFLFALILSKPMFSQTTFGMGVGFNIPFFKTGEVDARLKGIPITADFILISSLGKNLSFQTGLRYVNAIYLKDKPTTGNDMNSIRLDTWQVPIGLRMNTKTDTSQTFGVIFGLGLAGTYAFDGSIEDFKKEKINRFNMSSSVSLGVELDNKVPLSIEVQYLRSLFDMTSDPNATEYFTHNIRITLSTFF